MSFIRIVTITGLLMVMSGCIVVKVPGKRADFHQQQSLELAATDIKKLEIDAQAGSLTVRGQAGLTEIKVIADIYSSSSASEAYDLSLQQSGQKAMLVAHNFDSSGLWLGNSPRIDLQVLVPKTLNIKVNDGSGDISITAIDGNITIDDDSGDLELFAVNGEIFIEDGSGDIVVENVAGNVFIDDDSGSIRLHNINGALEITDGSGEIAINEVAKNVIINDDSGAIHLTNLRGDLTINDGSGDIEIKQVAGHVIIDDGSGDINVEHAGGLTIAEDGSGELSVNHVNGRVDIGG